MEKVDQDFLLKNYYFGEVSEMNKTNSQTSFARRMSKKKNVIIILAILVITVGQFGIQMSFIDSGNKRIIESLTKTVPIIEENIQAQPKVDEQIVENKFQGLKAKETDVVVSSKPLELQKNIQTVKVVQKELNRQPEPAPIKNSLKEEIKRKSEAERLRRAEKILTGF